jgi:Ca-activated chloride channel family protein
LLILPLAGWALRGYPLFGLLCALPFLVLPMPAEATESPQTQAAAERHAYRLFLDGKHDEAGRLFRDARWQAAARYRAGRFAEAATALAGLADADAHYNRGNALARSGDLRGALAAYEEALALRPEDADAMHNRDLVRDLLHQAGRPDERNGNGQTPPPGRHKPPPPPAPNTHEHEADAHAGQLVRRIPDEQAGLVQRKLALEHQRRQAMRNAQR